MTFRGRHLIAAAVASTFVCFAGVLSASLRAHVPQATAPQPQQAPMAESVYLDVQVLKGIPVDQFNDTMGMFASALLLDCVGCHDGRITSDPKAFAISTPRIQRARQMVVMMNNLNRMYFGGQQRVTCFTCHHGEPQPERSPSLTLQYAELTTDATSFQFFPDVAAPPAEKILARYIQAVGGAERVAKLTSFAGTGTYLGFETSDQEVPFEIVARSPDQRAMMAETGAQDLTWVYNGRNAWRFQPDTPIPLIELTGWSLSGSRIDTMAFFPATLSKAVAQHQVGYATIDGKSVEVVRGMNPGQSPVNLHFDEAGLLVRVVRWTETAAGPVPVQIDYSDYRDVAGVKMPFAWVTTWTNGQAFIKLKEIRPNVRIEDSRFARPTAASRTTLK